MRSSLNRAVFRRKWAPDADRCGHYGRCEGYKALEEYPGKIFGAIGQLFEAHKPDPQYINDAVVKLIGAPKGEGPVRTVVDPTTGQFISATNEGTLAEFDKTMETYGLRELLP
jgi:hypothetical protein